MAHYFDAAAGDWVCGVCGLCTDHCECETESKAEERSPITHSVERCKREIEADIASGRVPATVATFAELHDYVDANEYGGACEEDEDGCGWWDDEEMRDAAMDYWNAVQNAVDAWLRAGRPMANRTDYPPDRK